MSEAECHRQILSPCQGQALPESFWSGQGEQHTGQGQLSVGTQMSPSPSPQLLGLSIQPRGYGEHSSQAGRNSHCWMGDSSTEPSRAAEELELHNPGKGAFGTVCSLP